MEQPLLNSSLLYSFQKAGSMLSDLPIFQDTTNPNLYVCEMSWFVILGLYHASGSDSAQKPPVCDG